MFCYSFCLKANMKFVMPEREYDDDFWYHYPHKMKHMRVSEYIKCFPGNVHYDFILGLR